MLGEVWMQVRDFPDYEVSNYGRVSNLNTNKILRGSLDAFGYRRVALYRDRVPHFFLVHRLVAREFFDDYREGVAVKHKDNNIDNNTLANLRMSKTKVRKRYG